ncbi:MULTISPECIES: SDR family NAD(P)-dependent oxidoreductase [Streptomyces]|uniref:SDR family NAD(P)-dependent oxidoreductase n=1 Tax=Streptomyces lonegramiae TaxID=3075524 RepID=A0ABU2XKF9_9ACTN|nr:SDR family NAD(P)-dependent oxidoreductase [Streptomyces sp. DSM 41529]MDT0546412.1 SDR family NAD(P)-dependent oxidoreductase [Streptomyces sp. DSM 41529]
MRIAGATVLLTGATGGLGQSLARAFAARGAKLLLTGRREDVLRPLADRLGARAVVADLAERDQLERLIDEAAETDILIANAALQSSGKVLGYAPEQLDRALEVNLHAPLQLARALAPRMVAAGSGHIVMIGSLSGRTASPGAALYNATKFGLRGFALGLRQDLHGTGVGVSVVQPGFVRDTGMFADSGATTPPGVRTVSARQVAVATLRAVERDRAEVNIAPLELRLGSALGGLFPSLAAVAQRGAGADRTARQLSEGQRHNR